MPADRLDLGYRRSNLQSTTVVIDATVALAPGDRAGRRSGHSRRDRALAWANQPRRSLVAGSGLLLNPDGAAAGRLIDIAGLKGLRARHPPRCRTSTPTVQGPTPAGGQTTCTP